MQPYPPNQPPPPWGPPHPSHSSQYPQHMQRPLYQQQPPMQQPPPQSPKKPLYRTPLGIGCGVLIVLLLLCALLGAISNAAKSPSTTPDTANSTPTQQTSLATTAPTRQATSAHALAWKTTHTFSGNGSKKTGTFTVGDDWKLLYACTYQDIGGITADGAFAVTVYGADNTVIDPGAINATCPTSAKVTTGETEEHQAGQVYLSVAGTGNWSLAVQELR